eukprot:GEMP01082820.1.p1 GENE.GEMP01082820.1~~GEMP01082820.1.p1  ORF type:complete len:191 (-),score=44.67 GEMP01082820.1:303-875(-)
MLSSMLALVTVGFFQQCYGIEHQVTVAPRGSFLMRERERPAAPLEHQSTENDKAAETDSQPGNDDPVPSSLMETKHGQDGVKNPEKKRKHKKHKRSRAHKKAAVASGPPRHSSSLKEGETLADNTQQEENANARETTSQNEPESTTTTAPTTSSTITPSTTPTPTTATGGEGTTAPTPTTVSSTTVSPTT